MGEITLIAKREPKSPVTEAFRSIRTSLQFAGNSKGAQLIGVTSSTPGEGKSSTISNLAITLGQAGKKTILLDCDLRKPVQHKNFQVSNKGLTNYMISDKDVSEFIVSNVADDLDLLPSGPVPPNPAEILCSDKMIALLSSLKETYDYVLLDFPPILAVTDANVLSEYLDGVVLVVASGALSPSQVLESKRRLVQANNNILGVIMTKMPADNNTYYYYGVEPQE